MVKWFSLYQSVMHFDAIWLWPGYCHNFLEKWFGVGSWGKRLAQYTCMLHFSENVRSSHAKEVTVTKVWHYSFKAHKNLHFSDCWMLFCPRFCFSILSLTMQLPGARHEKESRNLQRVCTGGYHSLIGQYLLFMCSQRSPPIIKRGYLFIVGH